MVLSSLTGMGKNSGAWRVEDKDAQQRRLLRPSRATTSSIGPLRISCRPRLFRGLPFGR